MNNVRENKKPRICFILEHYFPYLGGAETQFKKFIEGLVDRGFPCCVVTTNIPRTKKHEIVNGVEIIRINVPSFYWFVLLVLPKLFSVIRKCDIVHTVIFSSAFPAWLVSRLFAKPCVITVLGYYGKDWEIFEGMSWISRKIHQFLEKLCLSLPFERYLCISNYVKNCLLHIGINEKKIDVIYPCFDFEDFMKKSVNRKELRDKFGFYDKYVYLYHGRPGLSKGISYLLDASPLIFKEIPNSLIVLVMTDDPKDLYNKIVRRVQEMGEKRIIVKGPIGREDIFHILVAADCVVCPSISEGFGLSVAEACAVGKTVVATRAGGIPEAVSGKYILVEPGNVRELADGCIDAARGKIESRETKNFSVEEHINRHEKIYYELLNKRR